MRRDRHAGDRFHGELGVRRIGRQQLGAAAEELGRAAFVDIDVRDRMAHDRVHAATNGGERQRVGGRAVENEMDSAIGLEHPPDRLHGRRRPVVVAIPVRMAAIGVDDGRQRLGTDAGIVVAGELQRRGRNHSR
jgi:hypothetical protein